MQLTTITKAMSFSERESQIRRAFYAAYRSEEMWCCDVYDGYVIVEVAGDYKRADYTVDADGNVMFAPASEWIAVEKEWVAKFLSEPLVVYGGTIKALGNGAFESPLVLFGNPQQTDLEGEYFDANTDFDIDSWDGEVTLKSSVYYQHGLDPVLKKKKLTNGDLRKDDVAIWIEAQLNMRDAYEKAIYEELIVPQKAGMSAGTLPNLVEREWVDGARYIKKFPLGKDASITPIPAEPRIFVRPLKSFPLVSVKSLIPTPSIDPEVPPKAETQGDTAVKGGRDSLSNGSIQVSEGEMPDNTTPPAAPEVSPEVKALTERVDALLKFAEDSPALRNAGYYSDDGGTADKNVKSAIDMLLAIKRGDATRCVKHYGLKAQVEDTGAQGGYFVPETVLNNLLPNLTLVSEVGRLVRRIPVPTPAGKSPIRDFSRVPTANVGDSASALGIASQGRAEAGAYTEETGYFELLEWNVRDYASGYIKMSRELTNDAPMVQNMLQEAIREDVANKEEFAILRGNGVAKPLGILNWAGRIEVTEDTDNTFAIADSDEMISRLLNVAGGNVAWVHHPGAYPNIAAFVRGNSTVALQTNIGDKVTNVLHGIPRYMSQHLPAQGTDGYVVLGDWSRYFLFELEGLYIEFSQHADFLNGNNVWRFGKRQDGKPAMTSAVTLADGSFTLSPFVVLKNKT